MIWVLCHYWVGLDVFLYLKKFFFSFFLFAFHLFQHTQLIQIWASFYADRRYLSYIRCSPKFMISTQEGYIHCGLTGIGFFECRGPQLFRLRLHLFYWRYYPNFLDPLVYAKIYTNLAKWDFHLSILNGRSLAHKSCWAWSTHVLTTTFLFI